MPRGVKNDDFDPPDCCPKVLLRAGLEEEVAVEAVEALEGASIGVVDCERVEREDEAADEPGRSMRCASPCVLPLAKLPLPLSDAVFIEEAEEDELPVAPPPAPL